MSGLPIVLFGLLGTTPRKLVTGLLAICCLVLASLAWSRLDTFSSDLKLWSDVVEKNQEDKLLLAERGYFYRGIANFKSGQIQRAQDDFIKAVTLNPKYAEAHLNLGSTNAYLKNFQAALQSYNTAIELSPAYVTDRILGAVNVPAHIKRSTLFLQLGRNADALNDCEYVLRLDVQDADAYLNCGLARLRMGKPQEALNYLDEALRINPGLENAYVNRSIINAKLGRHDAALSDLNQAERIDPKDAGIYYHRGSVHGILGRYQDAMQDYSRAIELDPNYVDAYINRGGLFVILKRLPQAILEFDRAIQLNPNMEDAYIRRGHIYAMQSRYQDALVNYDQALGLNSGNGEAMQSRAAILQKLNKQK